MDNDVKPAAAAASTSAEAESNGSATPVSAVSAAASSGAAAPGPEPTAGEAQAKPELTPDTPRTTDPEKPFLVDQPPQPNLTPTAAKILDPDVKTDAPIVDHDQRATLQNAEVKFGVTAAETAESDLAKISPAVTDVVASVELLGKKIETEIESDLPHPTLPHVFASTGRMYNESVALIQSLEAHVATLQNEGEAEMHAIAQRLQTLIGDFKSGVENIEASMSHSARTAIEALHKF